MRLEFRQALAAAREHNDAPGRIKVIKQAVANEVRALDPTATPRFTEYFNHSIAPDIVLKWPSEAKERYLFVRPTGSPDWLLNDMRFLAAHQPLVFTLEDLGTAPEAGELQSARMSLDNAAHAVGAWITDPSGTEVMSGARTRAHSPPLDVLSQALVRGGRGVSDGEDMRKLATETEGGFVGAAELSLPAISSAVSAIERHLDVEQSGRLTRLLRAIWESGGGDAGRFPATKGRGILNEDDLSYILKAAAGGSDRFWRGIGRAITTEMLGRLRLEDPSDNLQFLVYGNLETLQAKGVRLIDEARWMSEAEQVPRWIVNRGCLALRGFNWTAYVAARLLEEFPPEDAADAPDLSALRERAAIYQVPITRVQLGRDDRAVTYESFNGGDVLNDSELGKAEEDFGVRDIERAEARLQGGGGTVEIEFRAKTAAGRTSATFPLGSLMRAVLPLLADFPPDEQASIHDALTERDTLF